jgi:hypothetical protein
MHPEALKGALARALLVRLRQKVIDEGPPTEAELASIRASRWWEVDRPPTVQVVHAVVMRRPIDGGALPDQAEARTANELRRTVDGVSTAHEFMQVAGAFDCGASQCRVEQLPPITRDGNIAGPEGGQLVTSFADAAFKIPQEKSCSSVVETEFGWHIIFLESRQAEHRLSNSELSEKFGLEIVNNRLRRHANLVIDETRRRNRVILTPDVDRLLSSLTSNPNGNK